MVYVEVNINEKGQIVIPKILRDSHGLKPGCRAVLTEEGKNIVLKPKKSVEEFAKWLNALPKIKIGVVDSDRDHEEEMESRWTT